MKYRFLALLLLASLPLAGRAQPQPDSDFDTERGPPPQDQELRRPPGPDGETGERPPGMFIDQWLERKRQEDPAEFERLKQLRQNDPAAFRAELQNKIQHEVTVRLQREHPAIFQAIKDLPQGDREWLLEKLRRAVAPPGEGRPGFGNQGGAMMPGGQPGEGPDVGEDNIRPLLQAYRNASDAAEKEKIKGQIRQELEQVFDRRIARRKSEVTMMENRITELKQVIEKRETNRDVIIDRRLNEFTEPDGLKW